MLGQFFGFEGRIGRGSWWLGQLLVWMFLGLAIAIILATKNSGGGPGNIVIMSLVSLACSIAGLVVSVCSTVKRYHDRDKSGWWWFTGLVPFLGLWQWIECGFCSGEDAPNRFGPPPGAGRRAASLSNEISDLATSSSGRLSKLDDDYIANYAKKMALQQAAQQSVAASAPNQNFSARPAFGKR
jgi:uncharacterized membrane protein YhaH (DUF805 family)